jgi:hypothetical protein
MVLTVIGTALAGLLIQHRQACCSGFKRGNQAL